MSIRIEIPGAHGVHAGVRFTEGVATVGALGPNKAAALRALGATITDDAEADPFADLRVGDKLLTDCTVPELRDLAATEGIEVPAKATKKVILHAFLTAFMEED